MKWQRKNEDVERVFKKVNPIDIVFVLENQFQKEKAPPNMKYAIIKPVDVGISSENYYSIISGIELGEMIVTGGYRVLSKELYNGALVSVTDNVLIDDK